MSIKGHQKSRVDVGVTSDFNIPQGGLLGMSGKDSCGRWATRADLLTAMLRKIVGTQSEMHGDTICSIVAQLRKHSQKHLIRRPELQSVSRRKPRTRMQDGGSKSHTTRLLVGQACDVPVVRCSRPALPSAHIFLVLASIDPPTYPPRPAVNPTLWANTFAQQPES